MHQLYKQQKEQEKIANVKLPAQEQGGGDSDASTNDNTIEQPRTESEGEANGNGSPEMSQEFPTEDDAEQDDEVKTDTSLSSNLENLISSDAMSNEYVEIPDVNLKSIVNPNKEVSAYINDFFSPFKSEIFSLPDESYAKFKKSAQKKSTTSSRNSSVESLLVLIIVLLYLGLESLIALNSTLTNTMKTCSKRSV